MSACHIEKVERLPIMFQFLLIGMNSKRMGFSIFVTIKTWQQIKDGFLCLRIVNWKRNQTKRRHFDVNVVTTFDNEYMHITKLAATNYAKDKLHLTLNLICPSTNEAKSGRSISLSLCWMCVSAQIHTRAKAESDSCASFSVSRFRHALFRYRFRCRLCMDISLSLSLFLSMCLYVVPTTWIRFAFFSVYAMASSTSAFPLLSPFQTKLLMLCS